MLLALATSAFLWSHLVGAPWLKLVTLATALWAQGVAVAGPAGWRAVLLPGLVCLLALPMPAPVQNQLLWQLQVWTAERAAWVLTLVGREVSQAGVLLLTGEHAFLVVEECSGIRGARILSLVAIAIRELFRAASTRLWLVPLFAPLLGLALNVVRVALIAASADPAAALADHTPQGVVVLLGGTALLYGFAWVLALQGATAAGSRAPRRDHARRSLRWRWAVACWGVLSAASLVLPSFAEPGLPAPLAFPERRAGWVGEDLLPDPRFEGVLPGNHVVSRRYLRDSTRRGTEVVELFAVYDVPGNVASARFFSGKAEVPDRDWEIEERRPVRIWALGIDGKARVASRPLGTEQALIYVMQIRERGSWKESWRSLLQLEHSPFARARPRAIVRLATPLAAARSGARDRAKKTLDRFVHDFAEDLAGL